MHGMHGKPFVQPPTVLERRVRLISNEASVDTKLSLLWTFDGARHDDGIDVIYRELRQHFQPLIKVM